jgi:hypothetical protein
MKVKLGEAAFQEIITEANPPRYGRDGTFFPPRFANRSSLRYCNVDTSDRAHSSLSAWHVSGEQRMIEMRIPWGLLYVMDPSSRLVFDNTDRKGTPCSRETKGISVAALAIKEAEGRLRLIDSLPASTGARLVSAPLYSWDKWDDRRYVGRLKPAYYALKEVFEELRAPVNDGKEGK